MARIVALSSLVARGHVGLRAIVPALESFGHDVIALPTVVLSSHAGYPHVAGTRTTPELLQQMADAIEANGWLASIHFVITGYLPSVSHVTFAAAFIQRIRAHNPSVRFVCDPVLGDEPKGLYLPHDVAVGIREILLPLADLVAPNAFELSWLSSLPVTDIHTATRAARALDTRLVLATSILTAGDRLATLLVQDQTAEFTAVPRRSKVPSGTGDLLTGLFTGALAAGLEPSGALARSGAILEAIMVASQVGDDLTLAPLFQASSQADLPVQSPT